MKNLVQSLHLKVRLEGFVSEEKDFILDPLGVRDPVNGMTGVMWSQEQVWVSRRAAGLWV